MINLYKLKKNIFKSKLIKFTVIFITTIIVFLGQTSLVQAQFQLGVLEQNQPLSPLPEGVDRYGAIEVAIVNSPIDGTQLFPVTSSTVID